jgi:histidyl-tRNA synthetase
MPAVGFSANMELIIEIMEKKNLFVKKNNEFKIVIAPMADNLDIIVLQIVQELHDNKLHTIICNYDEDYDKQQNSIDELNSEVVVYLTEELIRQGKLLIKNNLKSHQEQLMISDLSNYLIRLKKAISIK